MEILKRKEECEEKDIKVKYDETKERWKPKCIESYIFINKEGLTVGVSWKYSENDEIRYKNGNCFRYNEQAKEALSKGLVSGLDIKTQNEE